jgi:hypothetical protein
MHKSSAVSDAWGRVQSGRRQTQPNPLICCSLAIRACVGGCVCGSPLQFFQSIASRVIPCYSLSLSQSPSHSLSSPSTHCLIGTPPVSSTPPCCALAATLATSSESCSSTLVPLCNRLSLTGLPAWPCETVGVSAAPGPPPAAEEMLPLPCEPSAAEPELETCCERCGMVSGEGWAWPRPPTRALSDLPALDRA